MRDVSISSPVIKMCKPAEGPLPLEQMRRSVRSLHREGVVRRGAGAGRRQHDVPAVVVARVTEGAAVAEVAGGGAGVADAAQRAHRHHNATVTVVGVRFRCAARCYACKHIIRNLKN